LGGVWDNAAFIDRMKIRNIPGRSFSGTEKAAVCKPMTAGQAGQNKKGLGLLFFYMSKN
jgi:hypothetical protein